MARSAARTMAVGNIALFYDWDRRKTTFSGEYISFIDAIRGQAAVP